MNFFLLNDYRCKCGKLLFKGFLFFSTVQVRCKRCGVICRFQGEEKKEPVSFSFTVDSSGKVNKACCALSFFGASSKEFIGKHAKGLLSVIRKEKNINFIVVPENQIQKSGAFPNKKIPIFAQNEKVAYYGKESELKDCRIFGSMYPE